MLSLGDTTVGILDDKTNAVRRQDMDSVPYDEGCPDPDNDADGFSERRRSLSLEKETVNDYAARGFPAKIRCASRVKDRARIACTSTESDSFCKTLGLACRLAKLVRSTEYMHTDRGTPSGAPMA